MDQDHTPAEQVAGYPSFVRRSANSAALNWWSPDRSGDAETDRIAGMAHLDTALDLFKGLRDAPWLDFYTCLITTEVIRPYPHNILSTIVNAMKMTAPMECGFLRALVQKAVAGRLPIIDLSAWSDEDRHGVEHACACIDLARLVGSSDFIYDEIVSVVDQTFNSEIAPGFVWAICVAAAAGALN